MPLKLFNGGFEHDGEKEDDRDEGKNWKDLGTRLVMG